MRWITNTHHSEATRAMIELVTGHDGKRKLSEGPPMESDTTPIEKMISEGTVGIYEMSPCSCALCKERRRDAALNTRRRMNKRIIAEKEE